MPAAPEVGRKGPSRHPDPEPQQALCRNGQAESKIPRECQHVGQCPSAQEGLTGGCRLDSLTRHEGIRKRLCGVATRQTRASVEQNRELRSRSTGTGQLAFKEVKRSLTGQRTVCLFNKRCWDSWTPSAPGQPIPCIIRKNEIDHKYKTSSCKISIIEENRKKRL